MKGKLAMMGMLPYLIGMDAPSTNRRTVFVEPKKLTDAEMDRRFRAEQRVIELARIKRERKANKNKTA